ncbi:MAG: DUF296 domain-containing protein [Flavobacteriales bacterium]|nr:DUF296 domain-containing protein [Flavobacteriales bacterium]
MLRLLPAEEVRSTLERFCSDQGFEAAAIISAVGSVDNATIRFGGRSEGTVVSGDLEICGLSGTLSKHGMHLHLTVADRDGQVTGGHLVQARVRTTLELVLQEIGGVRMPRRPDALTGHNELCPEELEP